MHGVRGKLAGLLAAAGACAGDAPVAAVEGDALAVIDYADGTRVRVISLLPDLVTPGDLVHVVLEVEAATPVGLEAALWPPRIGGRELALGSGVDAEQAARPDDPRVSRQAVDAAKGVVELQLAVAQPWHPRTAMVTVSRRDGDAIVPAIAGPRTRDGLGTAGIVDVVDTPIRVVARRTSDPPVIDGALDEPVWEDAIAYLLGDSLEGEPTSGHATTVLLAWDTTALYVAARMDDDDIWSQYEGHDDPLWKAEAFELFLFGDASRRRYLELQVSPRGVTFDARFDEYRRGDERWDGQWQAAVTVDGTALRRDDRDRGWVVEMAVPFAMICEHTALACPPDVGTTTRINAFRLDRPRRGPPTASSLAPTRIPDFHAPEHAAVLELAP